MAEEVQAHHRDMSRLVGTEVWMRVKESWRKEHRSALSAASTDAEILEIARDMRAFEAVIARIERIAAQERRPARKVEVV